MNKDYVCPHCHSLFHVEDLEDNEDGICDYCGHPLEPLHTEQFFPMFTLGEDKPKFVSNNPELNSMLKNLQMYSLSDVWHSVELLKFPKDRIKERTLFFKALKILGKKFDMLEG